VGEAIGAGSTYAYVEASWADSSHKLAPARHRRQHLVGETRFIYGRSESSRGIRGADREFEPQ